MGTMLSTQVLAGEAACITRSRLVTARPAGNNTIEMIDRDMNRFTVRTQACPNLDFINATVILGRSWRNLSCLNSSVTLNVSAPGRGLGTSYRFGRSCKPCSGQRRLAGARALTESPRRKRPGSRRSAAVHRRPDMIHVLGVRHR
jgi:hypothetical protein